MAVRDPGSPVECLWCSAQGDGLVCSTACMESMLLFEAGRLTEADAARARARVAVIRRQAAELGYAQEAYHELHVLAETAGGAVRRLGGPA